VLPLHIVGTDNMSTSHNKVLPHTTKTTTIEISFNRCCIVLTKHLNGKMQKVDLLWLTDGGRGDVGVVPVKGGSHAFD
jgi:hypothetical protein